MGPNPYRKQRNRRRIDPINYGKLPGGCCILCQISMSTQTAVYFNAPVDFTAEQMTDWSCMGLAIDSIVKTGEASYLINWDNNVTPGDLLIAGAFQHQAYGPNVIPMATNLWVGA